MGTIHITAVAKVPVHAGFSYVDDYKNVPAWMFGVTRFEPVGEQTQGLGATFDATMQLGPKAMNSRVTITEWEQDRLITLASVDGISNSSTWRFAPASDDTTEMTVDFEYSLPGGLAGKVLAKIVEPIVGTAIKHTESTLRRRVEELARTGATG